MSVVGLSNSFIRSMNFRLDMTKFRLAYMKSWHKQISVGISTIKLQVLMVVVFAFEVPYDGS